MILVPVVFLAQDHRATFHNAKASVWHQEHKPQALDHNPIHHLACTDTPAPTPSTTPPMPHARARNPLHNQSMLADTDIAGQLDATK